MNQLKAKLSPLLYRAGAAAVLLFTLSARADLNYADKPLFWSSGVQPNVALMIDTSGSMGTADAGAPSSAKSVCDGTTTLSNPLTRIQAVKEAACQTAIDNAASMRIGLYRFTGGTTGLQVQAIGSNTPGTLKTAIKGLTSSGNTPLSSAYKVILNDYLGANSPMQYRCQKNYTVFFTDGAPTSGDDMNSPLTYPTLTTAQLTTWPGGTGVSGSGSGSPGWDGFIDPIYNPDGVDVYPWLDDLAQFAYDVDMKTATSPAPTTAICGFTMTGVIGKDCAGKSWQGTDDTGANAITYAKQNVITYMLGFGAGANSELMRDTPLVNKIDITPAMVNVASSTITIAQHGLKTGDFVHYYKKYPSGVSSINATAVGDILVGSTNGMGTGTVLTYNNGGGADLSYVTAPAVPAIPAVVVSFVSTATTSPVNSTATHYFINKAAHGFNTGDLVTYTCSTAPCAMTSLTSGSTYYVAKVDANNFRLATTGALATSCAASADGSANVTARCVHIGTGTVGKTQTFTKPLVPSVPAVTATAGIYYAVVIDATHFKLATSAANAANLPAPITVTIGNSGTPAQVFSFASGALATIGGLYAYETDASADASPTPASEPSARGKYYVEVIDSNTIKLHQCGNVIDCPSPLAAAVTFTSTGSGILSTGPGKTYLSSSASKLSADLTSAFLAIRADNLSSASLASNSQSLTSSARVYQAKYNTGDWSGELSALPIITTTVPVSVSTTPDWKASSVIPAAASRNILTWNGATAKTFTWANLTAAQQTAMNNDPSVLTWVRGTDNVAAPAGSRLRGTSVLGDIINSSPSIVAKPNQTYATTLPASSAPPCGGASATCTGKESYTAFTGLARSSMVYAGANDGMLHGFSDSTGAEMFAFIPNGVYTDWVDANNNAVLDGAEVAIKKFYALTQIGYGQNGNQHLFFVDGSPITGDAFFSDGEWHTVLVGGLRKGGRSVYALDVTQDMVTVPFSATGTLVTDAAGITGRYNKPLWEFNDGNSGNMGYSFGDPQIARLQNGVWAAIFGNGYDSSGDVARMFIVDLETGALIKRIDFTGSTLTPNGLSGVAVSNDATGTATTVYAGDLLGNVWKVDISKASPGSWVSSMATPFFTATDILGNPQPITSPITLGVNPLGGTMLYVGTGSYFTTSDKSYSGTPKNDTMYALWDNDPLNTDSSATTGNIKSDKSELQKQSYTGTVAINSMTYITTSQVAVDYSLVPPPRGWYINLVLGTNYQGERIAFAPTIINDRVLFTTIIPSNTDACSGGGTSSLLELDRLSGGMPPTPPFDTNGDGKIDSNDANVAGFMSDSGIYSRPSVMLENGGGGPPDCEKFVSSSDGTVKVVKNRDCTTSNSSTLNQGRMSWRQLQ